MAKGFWVPMTMGIVAGAAIGLAASGMTTDRQRHQMRDKAGKTVRDILG